ncbi:MAG: hypothetical protein ACE5E4_05685 [Candidatus Binatia bacterium]
MVTRRAAVAMALGLGLLWWSGCDSPSAPSTTTTVGVSSTSSTSSTTTTSVAATTTTSTTTTLPPAPPLTVTLSVSDSVTLGAIGFTVDYSALASLGAFDGQADQVNCTDLTVGSIAAFNHVSASSTLIVGFNNVTGIVGPTDLFSCEFIPFEPFTGDPATLASSFVISGIEAANAAGDPIAAPSLGLSVSGAGGTTTTTTTSTSTSVTTSTSSTSTTAAAATTTTTLPGLPAGTYDVVFRLTDTVDVGAFTFTVDYSGAPGAINGTGASVQCTSLASGALPAFNDNESASTVTLGFITFGSISGPTDLATCSFTSTVSGLLEDGSQLAITVTEAVDPVNIQPIVPTPTVVVASITPAGA